MAAQETITLSDSILPSTKGCEQDPLKLVNRLTEGKKTDKEKFDVIFTWVVKNIRYDYYTYHAPTGATVARVDQILKRKTGICIDYAFLMDTLCRLAGLQNVSVYGYAKDDLFDVNDSLYMDNHAWNAVKLNNYWYLYDVTWSSGGYKWELKRFSKRLVKWREKVLAKRKARNITFKTARPAECDTSRHTWTATVYTLSWKDRMLLKLLYKLRIKKRLVFKKVRHPDYYLSNPEVFAITHFPDNPYWSLTSTRKHIREFETDSAYYYLCDSVYAKQERTGRHCSDCDSYFSLDAMSRQRQMKANSFAFNRRNRFVTWECNYNIADLFYRKSIPETDSLTKVSLIDSSMMYLSSSKNDLYQSILDVSTECYLQKAKNMHKDFILYDDNRKHLNFMHNTIRATEDKTHGMNYFARQCEAAERKYRYKKKRLLTICGDARPSSGNIKTRERIADLEAALKIMISRSDSLNLVIVNMMAGYNNSLAALSAGIWKKLRYQDSLATPFYKGYYYRWLYLLDDYKKIMVEERQKISRFESLFVSGLEQDIFIPSDSCAGMGFRILRLIDQRNDLITGSAGIMADLTKAGAIKPDSLHCFFMLNKGRIQENICMISGGSSKLEAVISGYKAFVKAEKVIEAAIRAENRGETERYKIINKQITWRQRKFKSVPMHNLRVTSKKKNFVQRYKRAYLKSLRLERKKSKK